MTLDRDSQLQALLADIDAALAGGQQPEGDAADSPAVGAEAEDAAARQLLSRVRGYLEALPAAADRAGAEGEQSAVVQAALQAVEAEIRQMRAQLVRPLESDLETLRSQRQRLMAEIEVLSDRRQQVQAVAAPADRDRVLNDFLADLRERLTDSVTQQLSQILGDLETRVRQESDPSSEGAGDETQAAQRLARLQTIQEQSNVLLDRLDETLQAVFQALKTRARSHEDSLAASLERMHALGQESEVILQRWLSRLAESLGQDAPHPLTGSESSGAIAGTDEPVASAIAPANLPYAGVEIPPSEGEDEAVPEAAPEADLEPVAETSGGLPDAPPPLAEPTPAAIADDPDADFGLEPAAEPDADYNPFVLDDLDLEDLRYDAPTDDLEAELDAADGEESDSGAAAALLGAAGAAGIGLAASDPTAVEPGDRVGDRKAEPGADVDFDALDAPAETEVGDSLLGGAATDDLGAPADLEGEAPLDWLGPAGPDDVAAEAAAWTPGPAEPAFDDFDDEEEATQIQYVVPPADRHDFSEPDEDDEATQIQYMPQFAPSPEAAATQIQFEPSPTPEAADLPPLDWSAEREAGAGREDLSLPEAEASGELPEQIWVDSDTERQLSEDLSSLEDGAEEALPATPFAAGAMPGTGPVESGTAERESAEAWDDLSLVPSETDADDGDDPNLEDALVDLERDPGAMDAAIDDSMTPMAGFAASWSDQPPADDALSPQDPLLAAEVSGETGIPLPVDESMSFDPTAEAAPDLEDAAVDLPAGQGILDEPDLGDLSPEEPGPELDAAAMADMADYGPPAAPPEPPSEADEPSLGEALGGAAIAGAAAFAAGLGVAAAESIAEDEPSEDESPEGESPEGEPVDFSGLTGLDLPEEPGDRDEATGEAIAGLDFDPEAAIAAGESDSLLGGEGEVPDLLGGPAIVEGGDLDLPPEDEFGGAAGEAIAAVPEVEEAAEFPFDESEPDPNEAGLDFGDEAGLGATDEAGLEMGDESGLDLGDEAGLEMGDESGLDLGDEGDAWGTENEAALAVEPDAPAEADLTVGPIATESGDLSFESEDLGAEDFGAEDFGAEDFGAEGFGAGDLGAGELETETDPMADSGLDAGDGDFDLHLSDDAEPGSAIAPEAGDEPLEFGAEAGLEGEPEVADELEMPEADGDLDFDRSEEAEAAIAEPGTEAPEAIGIEFDESGMGLVDLEAIGAEAEPEAETAAGEASDFDMPDFETAEAEASELEMPDFDTSESEASELEMPDFEASEPGAIESEASDLEIPDFEASESEAPDLEMPDLEASESEAPDLEIPDFEAPEADASDLEIPDFESPEAEASELEMPEFEASEAAAPDLEIPDLEGPEAEAADLAMPGLETADLGTEALEDADPQDPTFEGIWSELSDAAGVPTMEAPGEEAEGGADPAAPDPIAPEAIDEAPAAEDTGDLDLDWEGLDLPEDATADEAAEIAAAFESDGEEAIASGSLDEALVGDGGEPEGDFAGLDLESNDLDAGGWESPALEGNLEGTGLEASGDADLGDFPLEMGAEGASTLDPAAGGEYDTSALEGAIADFLETDNPLADLDADLDAFLSESLGPDADRPETPKE